MYYMCAIVTELIYKKIQNFGSFKYTIKIYACVILE